MTNYYDKYIKYKTKYLNLLDKNGSSHNSSPNSCGGSIKTYDYYFIHGTKNFSNLRSILKSGMLHIGKDVPKKRRFLCGDMPSNYVYANIYFEELLNLSHMRDFSIILHPKLLKEYGIIFNKGWTNICDPIVISKNEMQYSVQDKINKIKKFISDPHELPIMLRESSGLMLHEVLFDRKIPLENNILAIVCNSCSDANVRKLKKIIENKAYKNIPIITSNYPFPLLSDLFQTSIHKQKINFNNK